MFLGYTSSLGYTHSGDATTTSVTPITTVKIENGIFDQIHITEDTSATTSPLSYDWDYNTVLSCSFENTLEAGNIGYSLSEIDALVIKRRKVGKFDWVALYKKDISAVDDLSFIFVDKTAQSNQEYEYCIVPLMSGDSSEGEYNINTVTSSFDGLFLIGSDNTFNTILDTEITGIKRNKTSSVQATLGRKYPYVISNGSSNYLTGKATGTFIEFIESTCSWDIDNGWRYRQDLMDFLTDGTQKILKYHDGRIWLVNIESDPSEDPDGHEQHVKTSFEFVETGDTESNEDLYNAGIIDYLES